MNNKQKTMLAMLLLIAVSAQIAYSQYIAGQTTGRLARATFSVPNDAWVSFSDVQTDCGRGTPAAWSGCGTALQNLSETRLCARNPLGQRFVTGGFQFYFRHSCYFTVTSTYRRVSDQAGLPSGQPMGVDLAVPLYYLPARTNNTIVVISGTTPSTTAKVCNGKGPYGDHSFSVFPGLVNAFGLPYGAGQFTLDLANFPQNIVTKVYSAVEPGVETLAPEPRITRCALTPGQAGTFRIIVQNTEEVMIYASFNNNNCTTNFTDSPSAEQHCVASTKDSPQPNLILINVVSGRHPIFYTIESVRPGAKLEVRTEFIPMRLTQNATGIDLKLVHPEFFFVNTAPKTLVTIRVETVGESSGSFQLLSLNTGSHCVHRNDIFPSTNVSCDSLQFATNVTLTKFFHGATTTYIGLYARRTPNIRVTITQMPLLEISDVDVTTFPAVTRGIVWQTFTISPLKYSQLQIYRNASQDDILNLYYAKVCGNDVIEFPLASSQIQNVTEGYVVFRITEPCQFFVGAESVSIARNPSITLDPIIRKKLTQAQTPIHFRPAQLRQLYFSKVIEGNDRKEIVLTTSYPEAKLFITRNDTNCTVDELFFPTEGGKCVEGGKSTVILTFHKPTTIYIGVYIYKQHTDPVVLTVTTKEQCPPHNFFNQTTEACSPCPAKCAECVDYQGCVTCQEGAHALEGQCYGTCPQSSFPNGPRCTRCMTDCLSCTSEMTCTECRPGTSYIDGTCRAGCPIGHYQDGNVCKKCMDGCESCKGPLACDRCDGQFKLDGQICRRACDTGAYNTPLGCKTCPNSCTSCTSAVNCLTCAKGFHLSGFQCLQECPQGTYPSGPTCRNCSANCVSCNTATECLQCTEGYILQEDQSCKRQDKFNWVNYSRCNAKWGSYLIGSSRVTICQGGALLTSMASIFSTWNANCGGACDPANLNNWLKSHGGYSGFRINQAVVDQLGVTYIGTFADVADWVHHVGHGHGVVLYVKSARQWIVASSVTNGRIDGQTSQGTTGQFDQSDVETAIIYLRKVRE